MQEEECVTLVAGDSSFRGTVNQSPGFTLCFITKDAESTLGEGFDAFNAFTPVKHSLKPGVDVQDFWNWSHQLPLLQWLIFLMPEIQKHACLSP